MEDSKDNRKWAFGQIERLSIFHGFPQRESGIDEMVTQLIAMCPSAEDGEWLIDYVIKNEQFFPVPARLREILAEKRCKPLD